MNAKRRVILETLCLIVVLVFAGAFWKQDVVRWYVATRGTDPESVLKKANAKTSAKRREGYRVPVVRLQPEDMIASDEWSETLLARLNYNLLHKEALGLYGPDENGRAPRKVFTDFQREQYDKIVDEAENEIEQMTADGFPERTFGDAKTSARFRDALLRRALAIELKGEYGEWYELVRVYGSLYSMSSPETTWAAFRSVYARCRTRSPKGSDSFARTPEFVTLCNRAVESASHLSVDEALTHIEEATTRFENLSEELRLKTYAVPAIQETDPEYEQVYELYRFRDNCAKMVNPKLHFLCGDDSKALVFLTRKSYADFLEFMEDSYREYESYNEARKYTESACVKPAMEFFRKLAELPY